VTNDDLDFAFRNIRKLWERGLCPCCGSPLFGWTTNDGEEFEPVAIAEGVMICGRCNGNKHCDPEHSEPDKRNLEFILKAIVNGR
jgi:hypothetical protein